MTGVDEIFKVLQGLDAESLKKELEDAIKRLDELKKEEKEIREKIKKIQAILRALGVSTRSSYKGRIRDKVLQLAEEGKSLQEIVDTLLSQGIGSPRYLPKYAERILKEEGYL